MWKLVENKIQVPTLTYTIASIFPGKLQIRRKAIFEELFQRNSVFCCFHFHLTDTQDIFFGIIRLWEALLSPFLIVLNNTLNIKGIYGSSESF